MINRSTKSTKVLTLCADKLLYQGDTMNIKINYKLYGQDGQVILFKASIAAQVVANLAIKGATDIQILGQKVEMVDETMELVQKFRAFIVNE